MRELAGATFYISVTKASLLGLLVELVVLCYFHKFDRKKNRFFSKKKTKSINVSKVQSLCLKLFLNIGTIKHAVGFERDEFYQKELKKTSGHFFNGLSNRVFDFVLHVTISMNFITS